MEFYYDMLIPYMPDSVSNDKGEMTVDNRLKSGREAMAALSEFQITGNVMALYQAVINACRYADKDFVDTVLGLTDSDVTIADGTSISTLVDDAAKMLFKSINPDKYPFDIDKFAVYVLTATHLIVMAIRQSTQQDQDKPAEDVPEVPAEIEDNKKSEPEVTP